MRTYYKDFITTERTNGYFRASEYANHRRGLGHNVRREKIDATTYRVYFSPGLIDTSQAFNVKGVPSPS